MKKNLIIARCGPDSLHPHWLMGADTNFDLVVTYFGDTVPAAWINQGYPILSIKGPKWRGLHQYLQAYPHWRDYERIFLPDDDLMFDARTVNALFESARDHHADLCQPALDEFSHGSHVITLAYGSFKLRITNFVELMCPLMSTRCLEQCHPLFQETDSGWGMDAYWPQLLLKHNLNPPMIFDQHTVTHTRAVGSAEHGTSGHAHPANEATVFKRKYGVSDEAHLTVAGLLTSGQRLDVLRTRELLALHLTADAVAWRARDPRLVVRAVTEVLNSRQHPSTWLTKERLVRLDSLLTLPHSQRP